RKARESNHPNQPRRSEKFVELQREIRHLRQPEARFTRPEPYRWECRGYKSFASTGLNHWLTARRQAMNAQSDKRELLKFKADLLTEAEIAEVLEYIAIMQTMKQQPGGPERFYCVFAEGVCKTKDRQKVR